MVPTSKGRLGPPSHIHPPLGPENTPAPGMFSAQTISLCATPCPAGLKPCWSPPGELGRDGGAETSLPGIPPAFPVPCPPSSLPQPGHKLFQACKIWAGYSLAHSPQRGQGLGPHQETHSTHRAQIVLVKLHGGNWLVFGATNHRSQGTGRVGSGPLHRSEPQSWGQGKGGVVRRTSQHCLVIQQRLRVFKEMIFQYKAHLPFLHPQGQASSPFYG